MNLGLIYGLILGFIFIGFSGYMLYDLVTDP